MTAKNDFAQLLVLQVVQEDSKKVLCFLKAKAPFLNYNRHFFGGKAYRSAAVRIAFAQYPFAGRDF